MFRSNMRESIERIVEVSNYNAAFLRVLENLNVYDFTISSIEDDAVELWQLADMYLVEDEVLYHGCNGKGFV